MHRYRCPSCRGPIEFRRIFDGRHLALCGRCRIAHLLRPNGCNMDEAYVSFLEVYDDGRVKGGVEFEEMMRQEGLLRPEREVVEMVEGMGMRYGELPAALKGALGSRSDYPVTYRLFEEQEPEVGRDPAELGLDAGLVGALRDSGILRLYRFQEEAIRRILSGENVVIAAPTGSGKTEAFAAPIIQLLGGEAKSQFGFRKKVQALFVYPTKALARDQLPKIRRLAEGVGVSVDVFDGDTPQAERRRMVDEPPDIIFTNFDTLHHHFIHRTPFSRLVRDVRYVVIDEVHVYTGTFGSNVHFILRRLRRLCGGLQLVAASATIANPKGFCEALFGTEVSLIEGGEGRHGRIHFLMLFPTLRTHRAQVLDLLRSLSSTGYQTLVFSNSHLGAELTAFYARRGGIDVEVHRAGLLPAHKRRVEERFRQGLLRAISATPTLELGIDVGSVDSIVSELITITRLVQRAGRAGRRGQESLAFLSLREGDPISQYYKNNPEDYFRDVEPGYVDPTNPIVAEFQLLSAAMDRPLEGGEFAQHQRLLDGLIAKGLLIERGGRLLPDYPSARRLLAEYDIRGSGGAATIMLGDRKIGERGMPQAMEELHPEAVYFLGGVRYISRGFSFEGGAGVARVDRLPMNYPYYTKPIKEEWPTILALIERRRALDIEVAYCELSIKKRVLGYVNLEVGAEVGRGRKALLKEPLEYEFRTKGMAFRAPSPEGLLAKAQPERSDHLMCSSFHASEHVLIEGTNMITGGVASDMGGISLGSSGMIFVYDGSVGGNGATKVLYDRIEQALRRASKILEECRCSTEAGCPRCTYSYRCGNNNDYLNREGGMEVYRRMLAGERTSLEGDVEAEQRPYV